jgi:hypothetical protein
MLNVVLVVAITLAAAGQAKHTHANLLGNPEPSPLVPTSGPYQRLFLVPPIPPVGKGHVQVIPHGDARVIDMSPRVERGPCGMPIVAARPEMDPKMIVTPPPQARHVSKIRVFEPPPPCGK